jgi:hypothetical protein
MSLFYVGQATTVLQWSRLSDFSDRSQTRSSHWHTRHSDGDDLQVVWPVPNVLGAGSEVTYIYGPATEICSPPGDATTAGSLQAHLTATSVLLRAW